MIMAYQLILDPRLPLTSQYSSKEEANLHILNTCTLFHVSSGYIIMSHMATRVHELIVMLLTIVYCQWHDHGTRPFEILATLCATDHYDKPN